MPHLPVVPIAAVLLPEIRHASEQGHFVLGCGLALIAVTSACLGNLVAASNQHRGLPVVQLNTFGLLYGADCVALFALAMGRPFVVEHSAPYFLSLGYLALFGSVLAFGAYLTLIGRIGAGSAGYVNAVVPIVALTVSAAFEGLKRHPATWLGVAACLGGNVLVLRRHKKPAR